MEWYTQVIDVGFLTEWKQKYKDIKSIYYSKMRQTESVTSNKMHEVT